MKRLVGGLVAASLLGIFPFALAQEPGKDAPRPPPVAKPEGAVLVMTPAPAAPKPGAPFLEKFDLNKDGKVDWEEFQKVKSGFTHLDADGDGAITEADFAKVMERNRARMQEAMQRRMMEGMREGFGRRMRGGVGPGSRQREGRFGPPGERQRKGGRGMGPPWMQPEGGGFGPGPQGGPGFGPGGPQGGSRGQQGPGMCPRCRQSRGGGPQGMGPGPGGPGRGGPGGPGMGWGFPAPGAEGGDEPMPPPAPPER